MYARAVLACVALVLASACAGVDGLPGTAEATDPDHEAFCHTLGRALSAAEDEGAGAAAREAAEELLARAPDELDGPARALVDHLEAAGDGDVAAVEAVHDALEALRDGAARTCRSADDDAR